MRTIDSLIEGGSSRKSNGHVSRNLVVPLPCRSLNRSVPTVIRSYCHRELDLGVDVKRVEEGVIGIRGFVPLGEAQFFCSEECLRDDFDLSDLPSVPPRIP